MDSTVSGESVKHTISVSLEGVARGEKQLRDSAAMFGSSLESPNRPPDTGATQLLNRALQLATQRLHGLAVAMRQEGAEAADNVAATASDLLAVGEAIATRIRSVSATIGGNAPLQGPR